MTIKAFAYVDTARTIDLQSVPLKIKQLVLPDAELKAKGLDKLNEIPVVIELWEKQIKGSTDRGRAHEVLRVEGKIRKANNYRLEAAVLKQDANRFPRRWSNGPRKTQLWMPAQLEILDRDGKRVGDKAWDFVLPPLEYDDTLEIQLGCSLAGKNCGNLGLATVTWSSLSAIYKTLQVVDKKAGVHTHGDQYGRPGKVVIHSMCAINVVGEERTLSFDIDRNVQIFRNSAGDEAVAAHFIVDRAGTIFQTADVHRVAAHARGHNRRTVGIELLGFADQFREPQEKKLADLEKEQKKFSDSVADIKDALEKHRKSKAANVKQVTAAGKTMPVDVAIAQCESGIKDQQAKVTEKEKEIKAFRDWLKTDPYQYTEKQYQSLGLLVEQLSKRYGIGHFATHHRLDPGRKTDPGKFFDWNKILPYLPAGGKVDGSEAAGGGYYKAHD